MPNIIFNSVCGDDTTEKGGYVVMTNYGYFIATIFFIDHSFRTKNLFNSKTQSFVYKNEKDAIEFAKTGTRKEW